MPAIAVDRDTLNIAFRVQHANDFELLLLRAHPKSPQFLAGLDAPLAAASASASAPTPPPVPVHSGKSKMRSHAAKVGAPPVEEPTARYLGQVVKLSKDASKQSVPKLACTSDGCFVGWDAENAGAQIGYVRASDEQLLWYREVNSKSSRPSVASGGQKTLACWFEDGKVKVGQVTTDGIAEGTTVARASGQLPSSDVRYSQGSGDTGPGHQTEWFLAWRDYEAAEHEPFLARVECR
jgi:hypothetical protein